MKKNFNLLIYFFGILHRSSKSFLPVSLAVTVVQGISPLVNIIVPKMIIDELLGSQNTQVLAVWIAILAGSNLILKLIETALVRIQSVELDRVQLKIEDSLADKSIQLKYEDIERKSVLDLKERAYYGMFNYYEMVNLVGNAGKSLITLVSLMVLMFSFNGWAILLLTGLTFLNSIMYKRIADLRYQDSVASIPVNRGFSYFGSLAIDFSFGKDIRLSHCADFLQGKARKYLDEVLRIYSKEYTEIGKLQGITAINMQFQSFLVYGWLAWDAIQGLITIGDLTMYGSAARQFTQTLTTLMDSLIGINGLCLHIEPYQAFDALPEAAPEVNLDTSSLNIHDPLVFRFENVWFRYPGSDIDVLQEINIEIRHLERLSIVGLNGAGKTTFIKLLCRLYKPTQGIITLNGINIQKIPMKEYLEYLSVVFQDFQLLGYSVAMNIAASESPDALKIDQSIRMFGIEETIKNLPNGVDTSVNRVFDKEGVTFSGGQMQKFAIARALYKNSPVTILDEPTSALDPRSEYEVYRNFDTLTQGKTAIYISHRLSSTRFTDRIAVFQAGIIVELGTHDTLIAHAGLYAEMYAKQAQYYL